MCIYIIICHLTLSATNYSPCQDPTCLIDIVNLLVRKELELEGGWGVRSYRKFVKHDESYLLIVHCDERLKHDRLLTLIRLFEYSKI